MCMFITIIYSKMELLNMEAEALPLNNMGEEYSEWIVLDRVGVDSSLGSREIRFCPQNCTQLQSPERTFTDQRKTTPDSKLWKRQDCPALCRTVGRAACLCCEVEVGAERAATG